MTDNRIICNPNPHDFFLYHIMEARKKRQPRFINGDVEVYAADRLADLATGKGAKHRDYFARDYLIDILDELDDLPARQRFHLAKASADKILVYTGFFGVDHQHRRFDHPRALISEENKIDSARMLYNIAHGLNWFFKEPQYEKDVLEKMADLLPEYVPVLREANKLMTKNHGRN